MGKDSESQAEVRDVIQCDLNFPQQRPNCKYSGVNEGANNPFTLFKAEDSVV